MTRREWILLAFIAGMLIALYAALVANAKPRQLCDGLTAYECGQAHMNERNDASIRNLSL